MLKRKCIFLAGGGTGGHVFPALAIAEALRKIQPDIVIKFIGTRSGMESRLVPAHDLLFLPVGKLNFSGRYLKKLVTLIKLPWALFLSILYLLYYRPSWVLGVGGYASGPMVLVASLLGFRTAIWEANARPGLTNRLLARWVDCIFVVFDSAKKHLGHSSKIIEEGMPIREEIEVSWARLQEPRELKDQVSLPSQLPDHFVIFVFGGSQGARAINQVVFQLVQRYSPVFEQEKIQLIHQTGVLDFEQAKSVYQPFRHFVTFYDFIKDMPAFYRKAHLAICRAGASTVAELKAFGLVPIFIPLPIADNHQVDNASDIFAKNAGFLILQSELTVEKLWEMILAIKRNPQLRMEMSQRLRSLHVPGASTRIAQKLLS
ncbi:MAG: undecaprenyldiphospho-muramoylpentapeptide beta-N-acetylglucosaminyltransferase [Bdellovibrionaceae bacterium]|nr:undecaprenyldiphospho-muramoylpentapeptide beta-N-acetylglucosaminyltransferase [Pseudobdellovibrionaceae bacterium]MDW8190484.1 undecaprenyldiphospho-muramoylpentapeptide beta-N-acetylglucosaminyltransferase [Pseudobdellovibrionaceae bacterium]